MADAGTGAGEGERHLRRLLNGRVGHAGLAQIHGRTITLGLHQSNLLAAQLVLAAAALRRISYAALLFLEVRHPNLLLFNSLFKAYSLAGPGPEPLRLLPTLKRRSISPDRFTYAPLLKSCSNLRDLPFGRCLHSDVLTLGFHSHSSIRIALVELYVSCRSMDDAAKASDFMLPRPCRDAVVYNLLIRGYCKAGDLDAGLAVFRRMEARTVVSWNSMLTGLAGGGRDCEAVDLFDEMWAAADVKPDDATLVIVLPAAARLGALELGRRIHCYAGERGFLEKVVAVGNALINMYCKCGDVDAARAVFDEMRQRSLVSWNSMIAGLAMHGRGEAGVELFEEMRAASGEEPNEVTFIGALGCCNHAGMVDKGRELFRLMVEEMKMKPRPEHYGCMVDLLGRSGYLKEAHELVRSMQETGPAIWGALLGACRIHGEVDIAECAAKQLILLEPWNSGNYVLLSNMYAEAGRWDEVEELRDLMRGKNVHKIAGQSSIKPDQHC